MGGSIYEMEQLIRELNSPQNQGVPDRINAIQREIQYLQRQPSAWQVGLQLLAHEESVMRFYGALTLTVKINADWHNDQLDDQNIFRDGLLRSIIESYLRLSAIPDASFVLQKLCTTLTAVFQKQESQWKFPIRHLLACVIAGNYVRPDQILEMSDLLDTSRIISFQHIKAVFNFALTLSEDTSDSVHNTETEYLHQNLLSNAEDVWLLIHFGMQESRKQHNIEVEAAAVTHNLRLDMNKSSLTDLATISITLMPYWSSHVKVSALDQTLSDKPSMSLIFQDCVRTVLKLFEVSSLTSTIIQMLTSLLRGAHSVVSKLIPEISESIMLAKQAEEWISILLSGDFDVEAMSYVDFLDSVLSQADTSTPQYLKQQHHIVLLQQIQRLMRCPGTAAVDDTIFQIILEMINDVVEGSVDWSEPTEYDQAMRDLTSDTCAACMIKIQLPISEMASSTQTWDTDEWAKFRGSRFDVQDFVQSAFTILGSKLPGEMLAIIIKSSEDWARFETGVFGLAALSDPLTSYPETYDPLITSVLQCQAWNRLLQSTDSVPDRARQTSIKFLGENTSFLQRHLEFLVPSLDFLFQSLHLQASTNAASRAIYTLCDSQRITLTEALPQFLHSLTTIEDLTGTARQRIFGAVSAIIQALPTEEAKVGPLSQILRQLQREADSTQTSGADSQERVVDILSTLAAVGKGLRAPSDHTVDLDSAESPSSQFWTHGAGNTIQRSALMVCTTLLMRPESKSSAESIEAACDMMRSGFPETHPSPFKFPRAIIVEFLTRFIMLDTPNPDVIMSTASSYLASTSPSDTDSGAATLIEHVSSACASFLGCRTDAPTSALDFFARLLPRWGGVWFAAPPHVISPVLETALLCLADTDTLPRRTAASFTSSLFDASTTLSHSNEVLQYLPRLMALIIRLLCGDCARSEIEALTDPLRRGIVAQPLLTKRVLREALRDEANVLTPRALGATSVEQRARFAAQIEALRGARKTVDVVREFWVLCRGSGFGYV